MLISGKGNHTGQNKNDGRAEYALHKMKLNREDGLQLVQTGEGQEQLAYKESDDITCQPHSWYGKQDEADSNQSGQQG